MYWSFLPNICQYQTDWNIETADEKNEENKDILSIYDTFEQEENTKKKKKNKQDPSCIWCSQHVPLDFDI